MTLPLSQRSGPAARRTTIVVVAHNGGEPLVDCLAALAPSLEREGRGLVLFDNASADGSCARALEACPAATFIRAVRNVGFAAGVNRALAAIAAAGDPGDVAILVNQDCVVYPGAIESIEARLEDETVGVVGARIMEPDRETIQHAGGVIEANGLTRHIGRGSRAPGAYSVPADVEYVTGALLGFRVETWRGFGPFDERYFPAYFEETDFCVNVRRGGKRVVYEPASVAVHREASASGGVQARRYLGLYHRNRIRFVVKHLMTRGNRMNLLASELRWLFRRKTAAHALALAAAYARIPLYLVESRLRRQKGRCA